MILKVAVLLIGVAGILNSLSIVWLTQRLRRLENR
jgi:hypothetical protein